MRRLVMLVLALAAVAIAVTACGSEANDYRGEVKKVQDKYLTDLEKYRTSVQTAVATDPATAGAQLDQLSATMTKFADEVAAIEPPDDQKEEAAQLVGAYRASADAASQLKEAAATGDAAALQAAITAFNEAQKQETAAITALNAAD
jgi:hypothetical protein